MFRTPDVVKVQCTAPQAASLAAEIQSFVGLGTPVDVISNEGDAAMYARGILLIPVDGAPEGSLTIEEVQAKYLKAPLIDAKRGGKIGTEEEPDPTAKLPKPQGSGLADQLGKLLASETAAAK